MKNYKIDLFVDTMMMNTSSLCLFPKKEDAKTEAEKEAASVAEYMIDKWRSGAHANQAGQEHTKMEGIEFGDAFLDYLDENPSYLWMLRGYFYDAAGRIDPACKKDN